MPSFWRWLINTIQIYSFQKLFSALKTPTKPRLSLTNCSEETHVVRNIGGNKEIDNWSLFLSLFPLTVASPVKCFALMQHKCTFADNSGCRLITQTWGSPVSDRRGREQLFISSRRLSTRMTSADFIGRSSLTFDDELIENGSHRVEFLIFQTRSFQEKLEYAHEGYILNKRLINKSCLNASGGKKKEDCLMHSTVLVLQSRSAWFYSISLSLILYFHSV